ncbi:MAG: DUF4065 domain-containing protein [Proteobacteria bacterium]|nr:DUF4065 domain-containing protein [Pseudomonadota bacterium]
MRIFNNGGVSPVTVANYLLKKDLTAGTTAMDQMKLIKLVYMCHGRHLAEFGVPLVNELAEAWKYGPIFISIYTQTKDKGETPLTELLADSSGDKLTHAQKELADRVYADYGTFHGVDLMLRSHARGTPWYRVYIEQGRQYFPISNRLIKAHYKEMLNAQYA